MGHGAAFPLACPQNVPSGAPWPLQAWEALLLLLPSSDHWSAVYTALNKGLVNIGGPTVDWYRWVTIVQLLSDMCLGIVGLQEVASGCNVPFVTYADLPAFCCRPLTA